METLKDPAMILSISNTVAIVGLTTYFYKRCEAMQLDMIKISTTLTGIIKKLSDFEKGNQNLGEAQHALSTQITSLQELVNSLSINESTEDFDCDINEIISVLEQSNIFIERPSQLPRRRTERRGSRHDEDFDDHRTKNDRRNHSRYIDRNRERDNSRRDTRKSRDNNRPHRVENRPESNAADDTNDSDIINEIRKHRGGED